MGNQYVASSVSKNGHWMNQNDDGAYILSVILTVYIVVTLKVYVSCLDEWWMSEFATRLTCVHATREGLTAEILEYMVCAPGGPLFIYLHMSCMSTSPVCVHGTVHTGTSVLVHHYYISFV